MEEVEAMMVILGEGMQGRGLGTMGLRAPALTRMSGSHGLTEVCAAPREQIWHSTRPEPGDSEELHSATPSRQLP
jgi:hypothetical protein